MTKNLYETIFVLHPELRKRGGQFQSTVQLLEGKGAEITVSIVR